VLLAYAKLTLYDDLLASDLPDDSHFAEDLLRYFPEPLRKGHDAAIGRHRLRREIIATVATNSLVNRVGPCFVNDMAERTGESASQIARAYVVSRQVFGLRRLWAAIEALDNKVPAAAQTRMLLAIGAPLERVCVWLLRHAPGPIDIAQTIARYEPGVAAFRAALATSLDPSRAASLADRTGALTGLGAPAELAGEVAGLDDLVAAPELVRIAERHRVAIGDVAALYFAVGARFGCDWLRDVAARVKAETPWQKRALAAIVEDLLAQQADLAAHALGAANGVKGATAIVEAWTNRRRSVLGRFEALLTELRATPGPDLAALTLASRELRALAQD
jgi:glutamate dehydrogenase